MVARWNGCLGGLAVLGFASDLLYELQLIIPVGQDLHLLDTIKESRL